METAGVLSAIQINTLRDTVHEWTIFKSRQNDALYLIQFYSNSDFIEWQSSMNWKKIPVYIDSLNRSEFAVSPLGKSEFAQSIFEALGKNDKVLLLFVSGNDNILTIPL
jgi:hypothetical protein